MCILRLGTKRRLLVYLSLCLLCLLILQQLQLGTRHAGPADDSILQHQHQQQHQHQHQLKSNCIACNSTTSLARHATTVADPAVLKFIRQEFASFSFSSSSSSSSSPSSPCPLLPQQLLQHQQGPTQSDDRAWRRVTLTRLSQIFVNVTDGGDAPVWCRPSQRLAVLVAYRNREAHLMRLLANLHRLLTLQAADYKIFVIEQSGHQVFNRGAVFNAGYKEAAKLFNATCLVLHDVDMVPEIAINLYRCGNRPRLLSSALNKFKYRMLYADYFGGAVAIRSDQFVKINGFSNQFWGWGGEDDNFRQRIHWSGLKSLVTPLSLGRFHMAKHKLDTGNEPNPKRYRLLKRNRRIWHKDGLNSVNYKVFSNKNCHLYRLIRILIPGPRMKKMKFYPLLDDGDCK